MRYLCHFCVNTVISSQALQNSLTIATVDLAVRAYPISGM